MTFSFHLNKLDLGVCANNEPLNMVFFIYDKNMKQKLCEDFHIRCDANGVIENHKRITCFVNKRTHDAWIILFAYKLIRPVSDYLIYTQVHENQKEKEKYESFTQKILTSDFINWEFFFWSTAKIFDKEDPISGDLSFSVITTPPKNLDDSLVEFENNQVTHFLIFINFSNF